MTLDLVNHLRFRCNEAIAAAQEGMSQLGDRELYVNCGMSGHKVRHFVNSLCSTPFETRYLEVGLYMGSTFFSALHKNDIVAVGVDDWSEFEAPRQKFEEDLPHYVGSKYDVEIYNCRFQDLKANGLSDDARFNVYFYDGNHSYDSQREALTLMTRYMDDSFILIVDDYNSDDVINGTEDGINEAGLVINGSEWLGASETTDAYGWWNGLYVAVLSRK